MVFVVTTGILILTVVAFFFWGRVGLVTFGRPQWWLRVVVALPLLFSGIGHFALTSTYARIIPPVFPHRELLVVVSGVLELAGGVGLLLPQFSRSAASCLAGLMIAVFPANVYAANQIIGGVRMPGVPLRTTMQVVYIVLLLLAGWGIRRRGGPRDDSPGLFVSKRSGPARDG